MLHSTKQVSTLSCAVSVAFHCSFVFFELVMPSYNLLREYQDQIVPQSYNAGFVILSYIVSLVGAGSSLELMSRRTGFRGLYNQYVYVFAILKATCYFSESSH